MLKGASMPAVDRRRPPLLLGLVGMSLVMCAASIVHVWHESKLAWIIFYVAVCLLTVLGSRASRHRSWPGGLLFLFAPLIAAFALSGGNRIGVVFEGAIGDAGRAWWATGFRLDDAIVRVDLTVTQSVMRRGGRQIYIVAPVVPSGWTPREPVRFWMLAEPGHHAVTDWHQAPPRGMRSAECGLCDKAIAAILLEKGWTRADSHVLLRWSPAPADEAATDLLWFVGAIFMTGCVWTLLVRIHQRNDLKLDQARAERLELAAKEGTDADAAGPPPAAPTS
jgi:hypothetical protein